MQLGLIRFHVDFICALLIGLKIDQLRLDADHVVVGWDP